MVAEPAVAYTTASHPAAFWGEHDFKGSPELAERLGRLLNEREGENKRLITLKVEPSLLDAVKAVAGAKGLSYSALIRMWLLERLHTERSRYIRQRPPDKEA